MSKPHIADDHDDAQSPEVPGSHIRMRRDPALRLAEELTERYRAGEISLDELVAEIKKFAMGSGPRTAADSVKLRQLLDQLDYEPLVSRLRKLGPDA